MANIVLIDGGMGQELLHRSSNKNPKRWSAEYLLREPDLVRQVHLDYIDAGARVLIINAYSATYSRMRRIGVDDDVPLLQRTACELALAAREAAGGAGSDVAIAGCLPPLNGSYRADRVRDFSVNLAEYRQLVEHQAPHVDLFICETMSSAVEAQAAATAACESGKPVWVGWTLQDDACALLRSGETIAAAHAALADLPLAAVLANCTAPESVSQAIPELVATGRPAGGYANGFTPIPLDYMPGQTLKQLGVRRELTPAVYATFGAGWIDDGATIVGGCCEVTPGHIAALRDHLQAAGHTLVPATALEPTRQRSAPPPASHAR